MASPQIENGYTRLANELLEALCRTNLSAYESRILWALIRKTYGYGKKMDRIPLSQFSKETGLDRRHAHRALRNLEMRKVIVTHRGDKRRPSYGFQKDYTKWKGLDVDKVVTYSGDKVSSIEVTKLSPIQAPSKEKKENKQKKERNLKVAAPFSSREEEKIKTLCQKYKLTSNEISHFKTALAKVQREEALPFDIAYSIAMNDYIFTQLGKGR